MKNYNNIQLNFKGIHKKKVQADFSGGCITSDAGLLLLRNQDQQSNFLKQFSQCIEDPRHASYIHHSIEEMLKQRVYAIAAGYEDINDHTNLRCDKMFLTALNKDPGEGEPLASPSTLCRFENQITREDLKNISELFINHFIQTKKKTPKKLILDFDASDIKIHGNQEKRFYHGYYKSYCFLPLYVFCGHKLLATYLRPANLDAAFNAGGLLKIIVKRLREVWPKVKIIFRGDGGFCKRWILSWCERNDVGYVVGFTKNARILKLAKKVIDTSKKRFEETKEKVREFDEVQYKTQKTWRKKRRIIIKAEQIPNVENSENVRCLVTNLTEPPKEIYDELYVLRGDMENRIKEHQLSLWGDRTSCHEFEANHFRLLLVSAVYVLFEEIRSTIFKGTELEKSQCTTLRLKIIKVGAIIIYNTRRILIKINEFFPYKKYFIQAATAYS